MTPTDKLRQRLVAFGALLTEEQCKEFRAILDDFAALHYEVGEIYKMAVIALIPSKAFTSNCSVGGTPVFTPTVKPQAAKGDPLAELAANLSSGDRDKLIASLKKSTGE